MALADRTVRGRFAVADVAFQHEMEDGNIAEGERIFYQFIEQLSDTDSSDNKDVYRVLACRQMGDSQLAGRILNGMSDQQLIGNRLHNFLDDREVIDIFPSVAASALSVCIAARDDERGKRTIQLMKSISPSFFDMKGVDDPSFSLRLTNYGIIMSKEDSDLAFQAFA